MEKTKVTYQEAEKLGKYLLRHPLVKEVEIFGSVSRNGSGNDFDLIVIVSRETSDLFFKMLRKKFSPVLRSLHVFKHTLTNVRFGVVKNILGKEFLKDIKNISKKRKIDIFMLQEDWRDDLPRLQSEFPHYNPKFMWNIAKDAKKLCTKNCENS